MRRALPILFFVLFFAAVPAFGQFHYKGLHYALEVNEYPRADSQTSSDKVFLEREDFGDPIGDAYLIANLDGWKYTTERNAVAKGTLRIIVPGEYRFISNSYYDRNVLKVNDEVVCEFRDGDTAVGIIKLEKGLVPIESIGFIDGRGDGHGVTVKWKPPGQREFSEIPHHLLLHKPRPELKLKEEDKPVVEKPTPSNLLARTMTVVAKDFVVEVYHNGKIIPRDRRKLLLDRFGATAERVTTDVKPGDWLVFHVVCNRLRHDGARFFAVAGTLDGDSVTFVSDLDSDNWSVCDSPRNSGWFIREHNFGTEAHAVAIANPWKEGQKFMKEYSGHPFSGDAIWGAASSTWIKYLVPKKTE